MPQVFVHDMKCADVVFASDMKYAVLSRSMQWVRKVRDQSGFGRRGDCQSVGRQSTLYWPLGLGSAISIACTILKTKSSVIMQSHQMVNLKSKKNHKWQQPLAHHESQILSRLFCMSLDSTLYLWNTQSVCMSSSKFCVLTPVLFF